MKRGLYGFWKVKFDFEQEVVIRAKNGQNANRTQGGEEFAHL